MHQRFSLRKQLVVDTYRVAKPRRAGKTRRVRAKRRGHDSIVRWRRAKRARSYRVALIGLDGSFRLSRTVGKRRTRAVFGRSPSAGTIKVRVWALNRDGKRGRPGTAKLRTRSLIRSG